jgi:UDP-GlcNAc:undecaprenyl-phosphate GlcNAc-1-phosphate transferase
LFKANTAAGVMVLRGVQLLYLPTGQAHSYLVLGPDIGVPVTIVLVVLTINAVNFIDGLDGLAAGVVGIAALSLLLYSYQLSVVHGIDRATPPALLASVVAGACVGFLPHNFNPATVFMGDSGSMLIGLLLSAATVGITGQVDPLAVGQLDLFPVLLPVLLPLAVLAVPFVDLTLAVLRRTRAGRAPWAPDKQHLHHRLLELGHSHARAVLIMYAWTALVAFTAVSLGLTHNIALVASLALGVGVLVVLAMSVPRLRHLRHGS